MGKPPTSLDAPLGPSDCALGKQWNSKRRTKNAPSFSKASRFPSSKAYATEGELTMQCKQVPKFENPSVGDRINRRPASASFGSSTREKSSRTQICRTAQDRPPSMAGLRLSHYPVPVRQ